MKRENYRLVVISLFIVIIFIFTFMIGTFFDSSPENREDKFEEQTINKSSSIALMLEQNKGKKDYVEKDMQTFPTTGYIYNADRSGCVDGEGKTIENALTFRNGRASVTADSSAFCFLYFDIQ